MSNLILANDLSKLVYDQIVILDISGNNINYQAQIINNATLVEVAKIKIRSILEENISEDLVDEVYSKIISVYSDTNKKYTYKDYKNELGNDVANMIFDFHRHLLKDSGLKQDFFQSSREIYELLGGEYHILHNEQFTSDSIFGGKFHNLNFINDFDKIKKAIGQPNVIVSCNNELYFVQKVFDLLPSSGLYVGPAEFVIFDKSSLDGMNISVGDLAIPVIQKGNPNKLVYLNRIK